MVVGYLLVICLVKRKIWTFAYLHPIKDLLFARLLHVGHFLFDIFAILSNNLFFTYISTLSTVALTFKYLTM